MEDFNSKSFKILLNFLSNLLTSKDLAIKIVQKLIFGGILTMASILICYETYCYIRPDNKFILLLITLIHILLIFGKIYEFYDKHWRNHMTPENIESLESKVFMDEHIAVKLNTQSKKLHFTPSKFSLGMSKLRGYAIYGSSKFDFIWITFTMGFEYLYNTIKRIVKMYGNYGIYAKKHTSRKDFYLAMINSSMGRLTEL